MINLKELTQLKQELSSQHYGDNEQIALFSTESNQLSDHKQQEYQKKKIN